MIVLELPMVCVLNFEATEDLNVPPEYGTRLTTFLIPDNKSFYISQDLEDARQSVITIDGLEGESIVSLSYNSLKQIVLLATKDIGFLPFN